MATTITVGQTLPMIIRYLDQQGQPMATTQTPDLAPAWTQASPTTDALVVAPDGFSATARGLAVGTDTVSLTLSVGGTSFSATLDVQVDAAPQVLTSIEIVPGAPV